MGVAAGFTQELNEEQSSTRPLGCASHLATSVLPPSPPPQAASPPPTQLGSGGTIDLWSQGAEKVEGAWQAWDITGNQLDGSATYKVGVGSTWEKPRGIASRKFGLD